MREGPFRNIMATSSNPFAGGSSPAQMGARGPAAGSAAAARPAAASPPIPPPRQLDANQINYLASLGFSSGLIRTVSIAANAYPLRLWVIDNSLSMQTRDGHRLVGQLGGNNENIDMVDCTRWEEVQDCVPVHAEIAGLIGLPCRFILLNAPGGYGQPPFFSVGENGPAVMQREVQEARNIMARSSPSGAAPLTEHINNAYRMIAPMAPTLRQNSQKIAVILATDGLPSDSTGNVGQAIIQQFIESLKMLETLPVSVVVRLTTDDDSAVEFYNSIDRQLGDLPYDVLDDFCGEALEVYLRNPWLTYALPLHRFRELGIHIPAIDHLDEKALSYGELRDFCWILFAGQGFSQAALPDPATNWPSFITALSTLQTKERLHFNPVTKRVSQWINLSMLNTIYGGQQPLPQQAPTHQQPYQNRFVQPPSAATGYTASPTPNQQVPPQQYQPQPAFQPQGSRQPPQMQQGFGQPGPHGQRPQQYEQQPQQWTSQQTNQTAQPPPQPTMQKPPQQPAAAPSGPRTPAASPPKPQGAHPNSAGGDASDRGGKSAIKRSLLTQWALRPPDFRALRPIHELLCSIQDTFPPAYGVVPHAYFGRWKPFSPTAFGSGETAVLKRAMRKMKFFLHPDKLPRDLTADQSFLCKMLWDVTSDAWEEFQK